MKYEVPKKKTNYKSSINLVGKLGMQREKLKKVMSPNESAP